MKPSIGRIVYFFNGDDQDNLPAIITKVWSDTCVNLYVFGYKKGAEVFSSVNYNEGLKEARSWDWPEIIK